MKTYLCRRSHDCQTNQCKMIEEYDYCTYIIRNRFVHRYGNGSPVWGLLIYFPK